MKVVQGIFVKNPKKVWHGAVLDRASSNDHTQINGITS